MKLSQAVNYLLLASPLFYYAAEVGGEAVPLDKDKFKVFKEYNIKGNIRAGSGFDDILAANKESYMGGGFIDGNDIYVVLAAETDISKLARFPLTRDGKIFLPFPVVSSHQ